MPRTPTSDKFLIYVRNTNGHGVLIAFAHIRKVLRFDSERLVVYFDDEDEEHICQDDQSRLWRWLSRNSTDLTVDEPKSEPKLKVST